MRKILVIQDEKDLYSMFDLILTFHGFDVTVVDDGRKAMDILKNGTPFDAITLDLNLLGVSGQEVYYMLEKRGDSNRVLVINTYPGDIKDLKIRGVSVLEKPVKIEDLVDRVTEIVEHTDPMLK